MATKSLSNARAVKEKVAALVAGEPSVRGIGISHEDGGYAVRLNILSGPRPQKIPDEVDGVPIRVHVVGRIRKQSV
jgi:hypothetical protein